MQCVADLSCRPRYAYIIVHHGQQQGTLAQPTALKPTDSTHHQPGVLPHLGARGDLASNGLGSGVVAHNALNSLAPGRREALQLPLVDVQAPLYALQQRQPQRQPGSCRAVTYSREQVFVLHT